VPGPLQEPNPAVTITAIMNVPEKIDFLEIMRLNVERIIELLVFWVFLTLRA